MKQDLKQAWLAALRSGKYRQGQGALKSVGGSYCCLGVLCEVAGLKEKQLSCGSAAKAFIDKTGDYDVSYLPDGFAHEVDISATKQSALAEMNDDGKTFEQIADYIEQNI